MTTLLAARPSEQALDQEGGAQQPRVASNTFNAFDDAALSALN